MRKHYRKNVLALGCAAISLALLTSPAAAREQARGFTRALEKGEALMEQGEYRAAIDALKKAERLSAEPSLRVLMDLAVSFNNVASGSMKAERYARAALELAKEPKHRAGAFYQLGTSLLATTSPEAERLAEAEAAFKTVLELTGGEPHEAHYSLGEALRRQGRFSEAQTAFVRFLAHQPRGHLSDRARRAIEWTSCMGSVGPSLPRKMREGFGRPTKISGPGPRYTSEARHARIQGVVILEAMIDAQGSVRCPFVLKGLPMGLSEVAAETVSRWKFKPATLNGQPVAVTYNITLNFRLGS